MIWEQEIQTILAHIEELKNKAKVWLVLSVGISGSGKSTFIFAYSKQLENSCISYEVVCPDQLRKKYGTSVNDQSVNGKVWDVARRQAVKAFENGKQVVILDAMNIRAKERKQFMKYVRDRLPDLHLYTQAFVFPVDAELSKQRIQEDISNGLDRANVPPEIIDKMTEIYVNGLKDIEREFDVTITFKSCLKDS